MNIPPLLESIGKKSYVFYSLMSKKLYGSTLENIDHFKKWSDIERKLSPDEKKIKLHFFLSSIVIGITLFVAASASAYLEQSDYEFWPVAEIEIGVSDNFVLADEGFFGKASIPTIGDIDRSESASITTYTSQPGDTISTVAARFGIRVTTILDNNDIENTNTLESGTDIKILPVDGIIHNIRSGETLSQISTEYDIDQSILEKQNRLEENQGLIAGKMLIIPGITLDDIAPEPTAIPVAVVPSNPTRTNAPTQTSRPTATRKPTPTKVPVANVKPVVTNASAGSGGYRWPVAIRGTLTQGFHYGHYGIDIWGPNQPGIVAIRGGTVIQAAGGCGPRSTGCNGGYGNVIVIDHGGGVKARYAHNSAIYVSNGQTVVAGQVIGKMGNSGNVRGKTGIHLHFEMMVNGVKKNPLNYL